MTCKRRLSVPGVDFVGLFGAFYPAYVRGEAYLKSGRGREAAAEFEKIPQHPGLVLEDPVAPMALAGMGRAWMLTGNREQARKACGETSPGAREASSIEAGNTTNGRTSGSWPKGSKGDPLSTARKSDDG